MAHEITVPRLGWDMDEGTLVAWLKQDGEQVNAGDAIFTLEGDKSVEDIESLDEGILCIDPNGPREGDTVQVGTLLGYLVEAGERPPFEKRESEGRGARRAGPTSLTSGSAGAAHSGTESRTTTTGTIIRKHALPVISPRARRIATELGVDWKTMRGSGRNGRIREEDIRSASAHSAKSTTLTRTRRTIAKRMAASAQATAPVTLTTTVDATTL